MAIGTRALEAEVLLKGWITKNNILPGARLPSERDLAGQLGVHRNSLSRAMTRLIVQGSIIRTGYKLYAAAKKREENSFCCHLVLSTRSTYLRSYRKVAAELSIDCMIHRYGPVEEAVLLLRQLDSPLTEGIIFDPPVGRGIRDWEEAITLLADHSVPVVCIGNGAAGAVSVLPDYPRAVDMVVSHLKGLGHRQLALMSPPPWTPVTNEILESWSDVCKKHGLHRTARRIQVPNHSTPLREDAFDLAERLTREWSEVTALVYLCETDSYLPQLLDILSGHKKRIPENLSLIGLSDSKIFRNSTPPISTANCDMEIMQETAFRMVQRLSRKRNDPGFAHSDFSVRVQPQLILRASTAPSPIKYKADRLSDSSKKTFSLPTTEAGKQLESTPRALNLALLQPYDLVSKIDSSRFHQLDLRNYVNRPLNFRRGWLGDLPLKNFAPGEHVIHGVPFHVLGGSQRSDLGAVIFHSSINIKGKGGELPSHLRIPVKSKARAIYILHGCGYARFSKPFATYGFYHGKKQIDEVSLISLGQPPPDCPPEILASALSKANIQDWWPDLVHMDFPSARMAPINEGESSDLVPRHVYLYTLEWINPSPDTAIDHLEIISDASQSTTLGLLAVSVLGK